MLNISFWNIVFTILNLLIMYLLFRKFLYDPVKDIVKRRQNIFMERMKEIDELKAEAEADRARAKEEVAQVEEIRAGILAEARAKSQAEHERILKDAQVKAEKIVKDAKATSEYDAKHARKAAEENLAGIIIKAATKIVSNASSTVTDSEIYEEFLKEAGEKL